jgi:hypothetical protein
MFRRDGVWQEWLREKEQGLLERVQGELVGRWNPAVRCPVHLLSKQVGYRNLPHLGTQVEVRKLKGWDYESYRRVVSIHLCGLGLTAVPSAIFELDALEELHLAKNSLTALSSEISTLSALRTLDLRENVLTELPASLADLAELERLHAEGNPLARPPMEVVKQGMAAIRANLRYAPPPPLESSSAPALPATTPGAPPQSTSSDTSRIHVFISYSKKDQHYVDPLVRALQQQGFSVWIDNSNLTPGTPDWERAIREALQSCHAVVLVASPNSRESPYVRDEVALARKNEKRVIPLWVAGDDWENSIPLGWGQTQYIDGRNQQFTAAMEKVASAVRGVGD